MWWPVGYAGFILLIAAVICLLISVIFFIVSAKKKKYAEKSSASFYRVFGIAGLASFVLFGAVAVLIFALIFLGGKNDEYVESASEGILRIGENIEGSSGYVYKYTLIQDEEVLIEESPEATSSHRIRVNYRAVNPGDALVITLNQAAGGYYYDLCVYDVDVREFTSVDYDYLDIHFNKATFHVSGGSKDEDNERIKGILIDYYGCTEDDLAVFDIFSN